MNEIWTLAVPFFMGMGIGLVFFGGLWFTVRKGVESKHPSLWFFGGLLLRMGIAVGGFYLLGGGRWERYLVGLLGFILMRILLLRLLRPDRRSRPNREVHHAS